MNETMPMLYQEVVSPKIQFSRTITITAGPGLHARIATQMAITAQRAKSGVRIIKGSQSADGKSVIDILILACGPGSRISIDIDDPADIGVLDKLAAIIEKECTGPV